MSDFEVWLDTPTGSRLANLDKLISLELVHVANDYGVIALEIPGDYDDLIRLDGIVEVWFRGRLESAGFIRKMTYYDNGGAERTKLIAYDGNYILTSRIIAYAAGTAQAGMTDQADDMLKEIVNDNLLADAALARDISGLNLTKAANTSAGATITKGFSWRPLLNVCQDIAAASGELDKTIGKVYFEFVPKFVSRSQMGWQFQTFTGQRGIDHSMSGGDPVYIGKDWGNLISPVLEYDHTDEVNYVYSGGQGEASARNVNEVYDEDRYNASVWNRREAFADARNESSEDGVTAKGYDRLNEGRPVRTFSGQILDSPAARYGVHWGFGDKLTCEYRGVHYDVLVNAVSISLASDGSSSITAKFEVDA